MYINLSAAAKFARASQLITTIGNNGKLNVYTGTAPLSPDYPATGTLLLSMPLANPAATASYAVQSATVANGGTGGLNGVQAVTGTTGTGTPFQASVLISGGAITAVQSINIAGAYSVPPTTIAAEPVSGGGLVGATLSLVLTAQLTFNAIPQTNAIASGTAGWARVTTSGGVGVIDMDVGTSNTAVTINLTSLVNGGPIVVGTDILTEA